MAPSIGAPESIVRCSCWQSRDGSDDWSSAQRHPLNMALIQSLRAWSADTWIQQALHTSAWQSSSPRQYGRCPIAEPPTGNTHNEAQFPPLLRLRFTCRACVNCGAAEFFDPGLAGPPFDTILLSVQVPSSGAGWTAPRAGIGGLLAVHTCCT